MRVRRLFFAFCIAAAVAPGAAGAQNVVELEMETVLEELSGQGWRLFEVRRGLLGPEKSEIFGYDIPAGTREIAVFAVCDGDCSRLFLELANASGRLAEATSGDRPLVTASRLSGRVGARLTMARCTAATCAYRVVMLTK